MSQALAAVSAAGFRDVIARARALIFDVDGTMAETEEVHRRAFNDAFARAGLDWYWDQPTYGKLLRVAGGKERIGAFAMRKRSMPLLSNREIAELHQIKTARYAELIATGGCPLRPGVEALLRNARQRNQRLAIATTTSRANIDALLSVALGEDWAEWFEAIVAGEDVRDKKPAPDAYLLMLVRLSLPASRCIAIEDSRNGLLAASRAGIPVLFTRSAYFRDDDCSEALLAVDELTEIVY
jgi:HAD superfamily hydrolase (TIGR01509 family)